MKTKELMKQVIADVPSTAIGMEKWCRCSATELRYRLYFNHTWEEYCPKCGYICPRTQWVQK